MTQLTNEIYAVEVPEGACQFQIYRAKNSYDALVYYDGTPSFNNIRDICLPPGNWEIIATAKEVTEEQAKTIPGLQHHNFKEWWLNFRKRDSYYTSALDSFRSLLAAKGLDNEKNYVVVKKEK